MNRPAWLGAVGAAGRRAWELHPDVNRAPDAAEQFVALQQAYAQCLREAAGAAGGGAGAGAGAGAGGGRRGQRPPGSAPRAGGGPAAPGAPRRPAEPEEPFYGFGDFFRDLEADATRAAAPGASAAPRSSIEELGSIAGGLADELLDFLEEQAGLRPSSEEAGKGSGRHGGGREARTEANAPRARGPPPRSTPPPPPAPPPKAAPRAARRPRSFESLEVDEELQKLKREMGLE